MTTSTIDPTVPLGNALLASADIRAQLLHAVNDINALWAAVGSLGGLVIVAKAVNYSVLAGDSGTVFTNTGASASVTLTLPAAVVNRTYEAFITTAQPFGFAAVGSDVIADGNVTGSTAGNIQASTIGSKVSLICLITGIWQVRAIMGDWTMS